MAKFTRTEKQKEATVVLSTAFFSMLYGGSRSGKTFIIIRSIIIRALRIKSRHLVVRFRFNHAKASIWLDTFPKVVELCFPEIKPFIKENKQDWYWEFPNGSQIWLGGTDDKDRVDKILGNEYSTIYCNECSQISSYNTIITLMTRLAEKNDLNKRFWFDANPPNKKHWTYLLFIENENPLEKGKKLDPEKYPYLLMNPEDNVEHISDEYMNMLDSFPKRQRERFKLGLFMSDVIGALWTDQEIISAGSLEHGEAIRTVVSVDPAVTNNENSDETGIIVMSVDANNIGFVEADYTLKGSPNTWATVAVNAFHKHNANWIVAETNQGGDLVESVINSVDRNVKIKQVKASKGKFARAEPVQALYEQGKIAHCKGLELLENEMTEWVPMHTKESPNRIDALVWAAVSLKLTKPIRIFNF